MFDASCSFFRAGDFSSELCLESVKSLSLGVESLNVARVGFKKEKGPAM